MGTIRVADFIAKYIKQQLKSPVFMVVGGGSMQLNDGIKKQSGLKYVCYHHEQAAAIAAEGYARSSGRVGVVNVTSGPGGTNAVTGVAGQWLDSIPVLYISGQVNFDTTITSCPQLGLRQLGDQEINIVDIVAPITKYSVMLTDPEKIKFELEKAIYIATRGRPGPVWLDVPLNVQGSFIDEGQLQSYIPTELEDFNNDKLIFSVITQLFQAKRPVIIAGHGIRLSKGHTEFLMLVDKLKLPVLTTFNGADLIPSDNEYFIGRIGTLGSRAGNFALQNADVVLCIGTRNNIRQVSYQWRNFAKNAKKIIVDIDESELKKKTVVGNTIIVSDAREFLIKLLNKLPKDLNLNSDWLKWCLERRLKYPVVLEEYKSTNANIHPYNFIEKLTSKLNNNITVVAGNGTACITLYQAGIIKSGQRMFWNSGLASMGYGLPASIGAAFDNNKEIVCITGDGSLQMNIQELQTIRHHNLPIKLFVLNNRGYRSIEQTQTAFFNGDFIGCNKDSGISFPDLNKIANAYDLPYIKLSDNGTINQELDSVLRIVGPVICEVMLDTTYVFAPKISVDKLPNGEMIARSLEDLSPLLDREEFYSNMIKE